RHGQAVVPGPRHPRVPGGAEAAGPGESVRRRGNAGQQIFDDTQGGGRSCAAWPREKNERAWPRNLVRGGDTHGEPGGGAREPGLRRSRDGKTRRKRSATSLAPMTTGRRGGVTPAKFPSRARPENRTPAR